MPLQSTSGAASYDAFGGGVAAVPKYIEDYFSTFLYTGTGATQNIVNGVDLSTKGGLVWLKGRTDPADGAGVPNHILFDTARGNDFFLRTSSSAAQGSGFSSLFQFQNNGFTVGNNHSINYGVNSTKYASWSWAKAPKFFDVVTYTGVGGNNRSVPHNLGSVPGCVIVKRTDSTGSWFVWHRSIGTAGGLLLNATDAVQSYYWDSADQPTSTNILVSNSYGTNANGATYVAYLFAHNAGGFGLTGTDNVISCGSYVGDGTTNKSKKITLGYEPQFIIMKPAQSAPSGFNGWNMLDIMRGIATGGKDPMLRADTSGEEDGTNDLYSVEADGFRHTYNGTAGNDDGITYIYIAIRRGPMKVPTSGTSVFNPAYGTGVSGSFDTSFPVDMGAYSGTSISTGSYWSSRLTGSKYLTSFNTNAEDAFGSTQPWDRMQDWYATADNRFIGWGFRRAPSFFDEVCYTGTGATANVTHNLGAVPELMIVKARNLAQEWDVYVAPLGATKYLRLDSTFQANVSSSRWNNTTPTSTNFTVGTDAAVNANTYNYVAYLFATCAGVSKCFNYTGNGSSQTINCGFTGGARWVMIKRTDSTGDWYVWDTARGIVSGNDPHLSLNSTAAEVTTDDTIDTDSTGFVVNQVSATNVNVSSATYIGLAIA